MAMRRIPTRAASGLTLIELLVVLAVLAVLLQRAVASYAVWISNVQVRTATESMQNALQLARAEAIRRNRSVMFWLTSPATPKGPDWYVGCAKPAGTGSLPEQAGDCPGVNPVDGVPAYTTAGGGTGYNWIQFQTTAGMQAAQAAVTTTPALAAEVTFSALGMVTGNVDGTPTLTQINVANSATTASGVHPLQINIGGGDIRMCDPALSLASDPRGCL